MTLPASISTYPPSGERLLTFLRSSNAECAAWYASSRPCSLSDGIDLFAAHKMTNEPDRHGVPLQVARAQASYLLTYLLWAHLPVGADPSSRRRPDPPWQPMRRTPSEPPDHRHP